MTSGVRVRMDAYGNETGGVPVKVEVFDAGLQLQGARWVDAKGSMEMPLAPGLYGIRATAPSGRIFEQAVHVTDDAMVEAAIPLHRVSPHESQEWAYLTQAIDAPGTDVLDDPRFRGLWMRLWRRDAVDGTWQREPFHFLDAAWEDDGVSYTFRAPSVDLYAVQVGGPQVPWKLVALPPTHQAMVLVRPHVAAPEADMHPVDVVVSSDRWDTETLLTLMQRGDAKQARSWVEEAQIAERMLYSKMADTAAAAVGGYFLLRIGDLDRLHDWANNLAHWFDWMADGPVIHAWQLIQRARAGQGDPTSDVAAARERLLAASSRGVPLFTEGLRLLRDGLLLFDRQAQGDDPDVRAALTRVGAYAAVADWSQSATTFLSAHPARPSGALQQGIPRRGPLVYAYDVPMREALSAGSLTAKTVIENDSWQCTVENDGTLQAEDGRTFSCLGAAHQAYTGSPLGAWRTWADTNTDEGLWSQVDSLRHEGRSAHQVSSLGDAMAPLQREDLARAALGIPARAGDDAEWIDEPEDSGSEERPSDVDSTKED